MECEQNPSNYELRGDENPIPYLMASYPSANSSLITTVVFQVYHPDRGESNVTVHDYDSVAVDFQLGDLNQARYYPKNPHR